MVGIMKGRIDARPWYTCRAWHTCESWQTCDAWQTYLYRCSLNLYTFGLKYVILSTLGLIELLKFFLRAGRTSIAEYV